MGSRGRGRGGGGGRPNPEQFGLTREEATQINRTDVTPPPDFPPRPPVQAPLPITAIVRDMLDNGDSIKEAIRQRMIEGNFHPNLGVPLELISDRKLKKKKKKKKVKVGLEHLDELAVKEQKDDVASDAEQGGEAELSEESAAEEHDSEDSGSEDGDEEMDEGNDYSHNYYNEDEEDFGHDDDDDYNEAMA